jgi:hypothetical protein
VKARDLLDASNDELARVLAAGFAIDARALDDTQYRGVSLGLPSTIESLTWKTFRKVFHRDPVTRSLRGWNVRMKQNGIDGASEPLEKNGVPITFGHFEVLPAEGYAVPRGVERGLMLDYGLGNNHVLDPTGRLRDPVVALNEGDSTVLLGWTYVDIGGRAVGTPSYFTLEREGPLSYIATAPRSKRPALHDRKARVRRRAHEHPVRRSRLRWHLHERRARSRWVRVVVCPPAGRPDRPNPRAPLG